MTSEKITLNPILIKKDIKANCTQSVYLETKNLKLICSINGPQYITNAIIDDFKMSVNVKIKIPEYFKEKVNNNIEFMENQIKSILDGHLLLLKYQRTKLDVNLEVFEYNNDFLPYALMAISLCCNYANIEQKGILTSCSILVNSKGEIITEPSLNEEKEKNSIKFILGYNILLKENVLFIQRGKCSEDILKKVLAISIKICETYQNFLIKQL
jgi:ribonuclease PH